jgi:hypothetical protein
MTTADDDRRDELASALLDGDLPDEEAAVARRDPAVVARVAELAAARDQLRDVTPPAPATREAGLAAALAAFDEANRPTRLTSARRERRGIPPWLGAAATVALLAGVLGALAIAGGLGSSSSNDSAGESTAAAPESAPDDATDLGAADSGEGTSGSSRAGAATVVVELGDLGDFTSADGLVARVDGARIAGQPAPEDEASESGTDAAPTTMAPGPPSGAPGAVVLPGAQATCRGSDLPTAPAGGQAGVLAHAAARLAGTHVDVWLVRTASGTRMVALDTSCGVVADRPVD